MATLVTGGGGFVGINIAEELLARGERVVIFDRNELPASAKARLQRGGIEPTVALGDVRDFAALAKLLKDHRIDRVVHAAVITSSPEREASEPQEIVGVNVQGTLNVMQAAKSAACRRVVCIGSGAAYGRALFTDVPLREEVSASLPETLYGITKLAAEQAALRLARLWAFDVVCVRLGSVFGPWEFATGVRDRLSPYLQVAQLAVRGGVALLPKEEVRRDWIYSRDVAAGIVRILQAERPNHSLYHLSSGLKWSGAIVHWCEALKGAYPRFSWRIAEAAEHPNVNYQADRHRMSMDVSRLAEDIGFRASFGMREAYRDYLEWIAANRDFVAT